jgi:GH3 auxin-responsive promoter
LFLCRRKVNAVPDLVFVRRRSLQYSFTGEKLTAEQLSLIFERLRVLYPSEIGNKILTCVPAQASHTVPYYKVLLIGERRSRSETSYDILAARCDELLCEINDEYRSKRASERLGPIKVETIEFADFVATKQNWETQFKLLPLQLDSINPVLI